MCPLIFLLSSSFLSPSSVFLFIALLGHQAIHSLHSRVRIGVPVCGCVCVRVFVVGILHESLFSFHVVVYSLKSSVYPVKILKPYFNSYKYISVHILIVSILRIHVSCMCQKALISE